MPDQSYDEAYAECRQAALSAGALEPQGMLDRISAGIMAASGKQWSETPAAQQRLQRMINTCLRRKGFDVGGFEEELADCQQQAIAAGTLKPQGMGERAASGIQANKGIHWSDTPVAQQRYDAFVTDCMRKKGSNV